MITNKWCNKTNALGNAHTWNLGGKTNNAEWDFQLNMTNCNEEGNTSINHLNPKPITIVLFEFS